MAIQTGFKVYFECIELPVLVLDEGLQIIYCNAAYARISISTADEIVGRRLLDVVPELAGSPSHQAYLKVLSTRTAATAQVQINSQCFEERIYPIPDGLISVFDITTDAKRFEDAAQALAHNYHSVFDETWDAVMVHDIHTTDILEANQSACAMFGYNREKLVRMNMADLGINEAPYTSDDLKLWLRMAPSRKARSIEWKAVDSNGHQFWIEIKCRRLKIGDQTRLVCIVRDISIFKASNQWLRESRANYEEFFNLAGDFIFTHDLGGNFTSVNPAAEKITGYMTEDLIRMNIQELAEAKYLKLLRGFQYKRLPSGKHVSYELGINTSDGRLVYLDVIIWPVYKAGKPIAIQGIARDISELKENIIRLQNEEQNLLAFIEWLPDATLAINLEGKVVAWNRAMEDLTGIKAEKMLGKGDYAYALAFYNTKRPIMVDVVLKPEEVKKYYSLVEVDNYTVISEFPTPRLRKEGHYLWGRAMPWHDKEGRLLGAIECLRDITERINHNQDRQTQLDNKTEQLNQLQSVVNNLEQAILICDAKNKISFSNKFFNSSFNYTDDELIGCKISSILSKTSAKLIKDILKKGVPYELPEIVIVDHDGKSHNRRPVQIKLLQTSDPGAGFILIF